MTNPDQTTKPVLDEAGDPVPTLPKPDFGRIYGGDGHGSVNARWLVIVQPLADRSAASHKERIIVLDADVREAMALAARRLDQEARKYSAQGYVWDLADIVYDHGGHRVIVASMRIARDGST